MNRRRQSKRWQEWAWISVAFILPFAAGVATFGW